MRRVLDLLLREADFFFLGLEAALGVGFLAAALPVGFLVAEDPFGFGSAPEARSINSVAVSVWRRETPFSLARAAGP